MNDKRDQQLLAEYAEGRSEPAFTELVRRHVDLVYSAALRMVNDRQLAEDVTQAVFVALARNARSLSDRLALGGWLHRTAQNLAAKTVRTESRRRVREQKAAMMNDLTPDETATAWERLRPQLDAALGDLSEPDRDAVILRFFQGKSAREIGGILGSTEEAAQKRVERGLERLRVRLITRGVAVPGAMLGTALAAHAVHAAPEALASTLAAASITAASHAGSSAIITLVQKLFMTKTQIAVTSAVVAAVMSTPIALQHRTNARLSQELAQSREEIVRLQTEQSPTAQAGAADPAEKERTERMETELMRLRGAADRATRAEAELAQLRSQVRGQRGSSGASPTATGAFAAEDSLAPYLGTPIAPPGNLSPAYSRDGLVNAIQRAAAQAGATVKRVDVDDSEFPFLVGVDCDKGEWEKLKEQLRKLDGYDYHGGVGDDKCNTFNLVPSSVFPSDLSQRISRRTSIRTLKFYETFKGQSS